MIDVSQVLEFPPPKFYLLRQLSINKITHISVLKLTLNWNRLFGGGRLMEGALILPHKDFEKRAPWKKDMFKVLEPSMQELQKLELFSHEDEGIKWIKELSAGYGWDCNNIHITTR